MGRIGISYLEVANTASALQGKGINPTVDAVREVLGTGSRSTIGPYLKQWRDKQEVSGNMIGLPPELSSLVKGLYERLQAEADHRIEEETKRCEGLIEEIQQSLVLVQTERDSLIKEAHALQEKVEEALKGVESLSAALEGEQKQTIGLRAKVTEQEQRLEDRSKHVQFLENQLRNVQNNLEHYRESVKTQREEEKRAHEREVNLLTQEIVALKQQNTSLNLINENLKRALEVTQAEKEEFKREWYEQKGRIMEFQETIKNKDFVLQHLETQYKELLEDFRSNKEYLAESEAKASEMQKQVLVMQERLQGTENALKKAEDIIHNLQNERLYLVQEAVNLKANLKLSLNDIDVD